MAVERKRRRSVLDDPAVEAALAPPQPSPNSTNLERGIYERIARARGMTRAQRAKAQRDQARSKVTYDWPKWLIEEVAGKAKELDCPASHLAAALILEGLRRWKAKELDIHGMRRASNSPRFGNVLDYEELKDE